MVFQLLPFLMQILIGVAVSAASSLISMMFAQDQKKQVAGVRGTIQTGGDHPLAFIMGFYGTAGHLKYAGTWGNAGETPNAYFSKVVSVSDLPVRGLAGFFVNGERVTLLTAEAHANRGFPVQEYRSGGVDHLWVKFYDGTQVAADPLMRTNFGAEADRPYTADMIGRGVAYFVATALVNRELFSGLPEYFAEINGIPLDDPRGDNRHENPLVGIYTLMKGIRYNGVWVYGPQNITDGNFRAANLEAQMDKCDVSRALAGGGTESRFRFGLEVSVDQEPHAVIGELLKSCAGRVAEIGGIYKFLVGEPDAPVASITDEDIVITEGQTYEPFPGLEATFNGITATYPEPLEAWQSKEAPPRYRSDLELLDDNRRLPFSTDYKAVPFPVQIQELMRDAIEETRRFRRHTKTMPPEWWEYEPLDSYAWSSDLNGYADKLFLITVQDDLNNGSQFVGNQEIDPSDYDWDSDYELPWDVAPLVIARPAPQVMTGWNVAPYTVVDNASKARRPGTEVFWAAGLQDVRAVRVQARENWAPYQVIFDGEMPYDIAAVDPSAIVAPFSMLPNKPYQERGIYIPFSGRATEWSDWLDVTTPNVKLAMEDVEIELAELGAEILGEMGAKIRSLVEGFKRLGTLLEESDRENYTERQTLSRSLSVELGELEASFDEIIEVALDPEGNSALALAIQSLRAAMGGSSAEINIRWEVVAAPAGYSARYAIQALALDGTPRSATLFLDVPEDPTKPTKIGLMAGNVVFYLADGTPIALMDETGKQRSANGRVVIDWVNGTIRSTVG